jgi:hypothetical protein
MLFLNDFYIILVRYFSFNITLITGQYGLFVIIHHKRVFMRIFTGKIEFHQLMDWNISAIIRWNSQTLQTFYKFQHIGKKHEERAGFKAVFRKIEPLLLSSTQVQERASFRK